MRELPVLAQRSTSRSLLSFLWLPNCACHAEGGRLVTAHWCPESEPSGLSSSIPACCTDRADARCSVPAQPSIRTRL